MARKTPAKHAAGLWTRPPWSRSNPQGHGLKAVCHNFVTKPHFWKTGPAITSSASKVVHERCHPVSHGVAPLILQNIRIFSGKGKSPLSRP